MSKLTEYHEIERMLQIKLDRLEKLKGNPAMQQELAFKAKFQGLLQQYNRSLGDVIALLEPGKGRTGRRQARR